MENIVLTGFMYSGKTTVGEMLARLLGRRFVDMDSYIEQRSGMPVSKIFSDYGEEWFREREREACRALADERGLVIATGGGAITFPENVITLKKSGVIVFLDVPIEVILNRMKDDKTRPLLSGSEREETARKLFIQRQPLYHAAADIIVDGTESPIKVGQAILENLKSSR